MDQPQDPESSLDWSVVEFDRWADEQLQATKSPEPVVSAVLRRLQAGRITSRRMMTEPLRLLLNYEGQIERHDRQLTRHYAELLIPLASHDPIASAKIHYTYSQALRRAGQNDLALTAYESAADLAEVERVEVAMIFIFANVSAGYERLARNDHQGADMRFRKALGIAWFIKPPDQENVRHLFEQSVRAARGRIAANRDDLEALRTLRFVPAVMHRVEDELNAAIEAAKQRAGGADLENR
jgi:hypothetical protein